MSKRTGAAVEIGGRVGEPETFEGFFDRSYEPVLRAMFLVAGGRLEAEEVTQEAFVRVYERWEAIRDRPNPAGYAYRVALNVHRSRSRRLRLAARRIVQPQPSDPLDAVEARDELRIALANLPWGQRAALVLVEWLEMTDVEAADVLGITPGAVRVRLSRARKALRREPQKGNDDD